MKNFAGRRCGDIPGVSSHEYLDSRRLPPREACVLEFVHIKQYAAAAVDLEVFVDEPKDLATCQSGLLVLSFTQFDTIHLLTQRAIVSRNAFVQREKGFTILTLERTCVGERLKNSRSVSNL